ncbi:hypothetical protein [Halomarina pelagica]|uniref:hypothetical protein n=1 Tax=Halomarina pelagica TaxID=2961599 RepID=UPI0020C56C5B|nr:hypothetical protein [Halomarina sp. BND7]
MSDHDAVDGLDDEERATVEGMERGLEWFYRAHGVLVAVRHAVGSAMDHFEEAPGPPWRARRDREPSRRQALPGGAR